MILSRPWRLESYLIASIRCIGGKILGLKGDLRGRERFIATFANAPQPFILLTHGSP
jgi:hypothetical protein